MTGPSTEAVTGRYRLPVAGCLLPADNLSYIRNVSMTALSAGDTLRCG